MGFRYLDRIATREHLQDFLELTDLAAGAGEETANAFLVAHRLRDSAPMRLCERLSGPYDVEALRALPPGTLGHTYVTVLDALGYDINFFPEPSFFQNLETDADSAASASMVLARSA
jgi:hypothetical protein